MKTLSRELGALFRPAPPRRGDPHRKARERAKALAARLGVEVERLAGGGMNVWPPRGLASHADPFEGDHYAQDWPDALQRVEAYEAASNKESARMNEHGTFHTSSNELSDHSTTHDVYFSSHDGQQLIAEPPSEAVAALLAHALNRVVNRFLDARSEREAVAFSEALDRLIGE